MFLKTDCTVSGRPHEAGFVTVGIYDPASEKDQKQIRQIADIYYSGPVDPDSII